MSFAIICFIYLGVGAFAGILSGFLGVGGAIITVPCLLLLLPLLNVPEAWVMHVAVATSLAAMIFTATSAMLAHHKKESVLWDALRRLVPGLVLGAILGAIIAVWLKGNVLEMLFGIFLLSMAIRFYFGKPIHTRQHKLPSSWILNLFSLGIGTVCSMLGVGSGSMTVFLLTFFHVKDRIAIGTATATTLVATVCSTTMYLILGWGAIKRPDTMGLVNIPAFLIIGLAAFFAAPYGVKLTHAINPAKVRKIFAFVLVAAGLWLIL